MTCVVFAPLGETDTARSHPRVTRQDAAVKIRCKCRVATVNKGCMYDGQRLRRQKSKQCRRNAVGAGCPTGAHVVDDVLQILERDVR